MKKQSANFAQGAPVPAPPVPGRAAGSAPLAEDLAEQAPDAAGPKPREAAAHILSGPVHRGVLRVALPSVATMLLQSTNSFLDRFFVGSLGPDALAAVTVSSSLMFALMAAAMAISVGTTALVARSVGEGQEEQAERATQQSLLLSAAVAVVVALPMWVLRRPLLSILGLQTETMGLAVAYLNLLLLGLPFLFTMLILNGAFRGLGDTTRPFWVSLGANIVHAVGNWLLIFGNLGFPRLGLPGGALALAISQAVSLLLYLYFLSRSPLRGALGRRGWGVDLDWSWRIARIGLPASAQQLIRVGSMLAFQGILARTAAGSAAVAAFGVGLVSESIAFMPGFGYSIAASAFVGQNLGARQVKRANAGAWAATWQALLVMSVMGVVFWTFAEPFARLFLHASEAAPGQQEEIARTIALTVAY
ncbi:MAG: Multi antimicrobial extrusion protein (Na(+)/drug antiporter), MATE family of MDR efflux pumps, partial [uncultured Thermomicrobiales bacterium]